MTVDFENLRASGWPPLACAAHAESEGLSRLEAFKGVMDQWGAAPFSVDEMLEYGSGYPSRAAHGVATVGLAAIVLEYPTASFDEVATFDRTTGISRKVEALARADRTDEALGFYDRLEPGALRLTALTQAEARHIVRSIRAPNSSLSSVVIDSISHHQWGWLFSPGLDEDTAGAGHAPGAAGSPILLDRFTGVAIRVDCGDSTGESLAECLDLAVKRYEETGWPIPRDPPPT